MYSIRLIYISDCFRSSSMATSQHLYLAWSQSQLTGNKICNYNDKYKSIALPYIHCIPFNIVSVRLHKNTR